MKQKMKKPIGRQSQLHSFAGDFPLQYGNFYEDCTYQRYPYVLGASELMLLHIVQQSPTRNFLPGCDIPLSSIPPNIRQTIPMNRRQTNISQDYVLVIYFRIIHCSPVSSFHGSESRIHESSLSSINPDSFLQPWHLLELDQIFRGLTGDKAMKLHKISHNDSLDRHLLPFSLCDITSHLLFTPDRFLRIIPVAVYLSAERPTTILGRTAPSGLVYLSILLHIA